jgi:hypothetical protein
MNYSSRFGSYRAVNTLGIDYENQSVYGWEHITVSPAIHKITDTHSVDIMLKFLILNLAVHRKHYALKQLRNCYSVGKHKPKTSCRRRSVTYLCVWSVVYIQHRIDYSISITTPNGRPWYLLQEALHQTQVTVVTKWPTKISEWCWSRKALNITGS